MNISSLNISSLISSANFKPLILSQKIDPAQEGKTLPGTRENGKMDVTKGTESFAVILELAKQKK